MKEAMLILHERHHNLMEMSYSGQHSSSYTSGTSQTFKISQKKI